MTDTYYRYVDVRYAGGVDEWGDPIRGDGRTGIVLHEFRVIRETAKGVWIQGDHGRKFIKTNALKHWALWSKEAALDSFIARKEKQLRIYAARSKYVREALFQAYAMLPEDSFGKQIADLPLS